MIKLFRFYILWIGLPLFSIILSLSPTHVILVESKTGNENGNNTIKSSTYSSIFEWALR